MIVRGLGDGAPTPSEPALPEPVHPAMESAALWLGVMVAGLVLAQFVIKRP